MILTISICLLIFAVLFLIYGIHQYVLDKKYRLPPGPPPLPFIGNMLNLSEKAKIWMGYRDLSLQYGPIFTFYLGQYRMVVLSSPDAIQEAIVAQNKLFYNRPVNIVPGFENFPAGVILANGEMWQRRRRFALKTLRDFGMGKTAIVEKIHYEIGFFLEEMEERTYRPFDPQRLLANTVSNVICSLVFGKRFDYDDEEFLKFLDMFQSVVSRQVSKRLLFYALPFVRHLFRPQLAIKMLTLLDQVKFKLKKSVNEHRQDYDGDNIRDFPDLFIQAEMTDDELDFDAFSLTMIDLFMAGTETTATSLNWTLLYLSTYPDLQRKCHDAIDRVIDTDRLPTLADRPKLVYIDAVMCEVLRHATIAPLALAHSNLGVKTMVAGYDIPENSIVVYNLWALHHDPIYWTEPDRFNPDRWIDANGKLVTHSTHFMPFGTGSRVCLGELLAKVEYFVFLVALLQRFTFALADAKVSLENGIPGVTYSPPRYKLMASKR